MWNIDVIGNQGEVITAVNTKLQSAITNQQYLDVRQLTDLYRYVRSACGDTIDAGLTYGLVTAFTSEEQKMHLVAFGNTTANSNTFRIKFQVVTTNSANTTIYGNPPDLQPPPQLLVTS